MKAYIVLLVVCVLISYSSSASSLGKPDTITTPGGDTECYDPAPSQRKCSIFPFKSSLNDGKEIQAFSFVKAAYANCKEINEQNEYAPYVFACYVSLGVCNNKKWAIPNGINVNGLHEMLRTQEFPNLSDGNADKPVMCKATCEEAVRLAKDCQSSAPLKSMSNIANICKNLPDSDCIDNQKMKEYMTKTSAATLNMAKPLGLTALFALFLTLSIFSTLF